MRDKIAGGLLLGLVVLAADLGTKWAVVDNMPLCHARSGPGVTRLALDGCQRLWLIGPTYLVRIENVGSAFGLFWGEVNWAWVGALGALLVPVYALLAGRMSWLMALSVSLQLSGAVGNIVDRAAHAGVTDFIVLGGGPVFNIADVALLLGTVGALGALASYRVTPDVRGASRLLQSVRARARRLTF